jgi:hypothetical protein
MASLTWTTNLNPSMDGQAWASLELTLSTRKEDREDRCLLELWLTPFLLPSLLSTCKEQGARSKEQGAIQEAVATSLMEL